MLDGFTGSEVSGTELWRRDAFHSEQDYTRTQGLFLSIEDDGQGPGEPPR